jgi:two-component system, sensor histidine kinase RpfC
MGTALSRKAAPLRQLLILVASDKMTSQSVATEILERAGHSVMTFGDGDRALDALEVNEFDLVLMDVNLPVANGIELTKLYRFISLDQPYVPIVAVMGAATEEEKRRCKDAGMDACITTPIERHQLLEIITTLVHDDSRNQRSVPNAGGRADHCSAPAAAIDLRALSALESLGGREFADQLAAQFLDDASEILHDLTEEMASGDATAFSKLYILRNSSANIGARGIYDMCSAWSQVAPETLAVLSETELERLREECGRVCIALRERLLARNGTIGHSVNARDRLLVHPVHMA